jgi:hypothetical protein
MFCIRSLQQERCCDDTHPSDVRPPTPRMLAESEPTRQLPCLTSSQSCATHHPQSPSRPLGTCVAGGCGGSRKKNLSLAKNDSEDEMEV